MSEARRTLEHCIINGLSTRAGETGATIEYAHIQIPDILDAIFRPGIFWAVEDYLEECKERSRQEVVRLMEADDG